MLNTKILTAVTDMLPHYALIKQLDYKFDEYTYQTYLNDMVAKGYKQLAVYNDAKCVAIAGFWIATKLYCGRYVELDNVIVDKDVRSSGIGNLICETIEAVAIKEGCSVGVLDAYVQNDRAHKFYMKKGYRILGFHFIKNLAG